MARKLTKKQTSVQKAYNRNRKRIQSFIRRIERQGFEVPDTLLPKIPKKITEGSVRRLEKITPKSIYSSSRFVDYETGEILTSSQGIKLRRKRNKANQEAGSGVLPFSDKVIDEFENLIDNYFALSRDIALQWFKEMLSQLTREQVAKMLEKGRYNGNWLTPKEAYDYDLLQENLMDMLEFLDVSPEDRTNIINEIANEIDMEWY